jgi:hypothetical protein
LHRKPSLYQSYQQSVRNPTDHPLRALGASA